MDLPQPPPDQELKNIIDKLAQFVARNGPEFEHMTKQKQKDNPKFSFLFGGTYFHYYQYRVTSEQANHCDENLIAVIKQKQRTLEQQAIVQQAINRQSIQTAPWNGSTEAGAGGARLPGPWIQHLNQIQDTSQEQILQSEQNLAAQHQLLLQQQQMQVDEVIRKAQDEKLDKQAKENDLDLKELDGILQPIIDSCTKDSISTGKGWIFSHATNPARSEVIILYILKRVTEPGATFVTKLHLVYLINDVLHHCFRKNAEDLKKILERSVVPIFCSTSIGVEVDKQQKLSKLHKLWETNKYFSTQILDQLQNPTSSLAAYQAGLIAEYAHLITPITTAIQAQYALLQKQHQDFVAHLTGQMHQMQIPAQYAFQAAQNPLVQQAASSPYMHPAAYDQAPVMGQEQRLHTAQLPEDIAKVTSDVDLEQQMDIPNIEKEMESRMDKEPMHSEDRVPDMHNSDRIPDIDSPMHGGRMHDYPPDDMLDPPYGHPDLPGRHPNGRSVGGYMDDYSPHYGHPPGGYGGEMPEYRMTPPHGSYGHHPRPYRDVPLDMPPDYLEPAGPPICPPYYDLPAGLMVPLVGLEDTDYESPLEPDDVRLPAPALPTDRLLAAVEQFYCPPTHERTRNNSYVISSEGWEQLGLYEFFKAKAQAKKQKGMSTNDDVKDYGTSMDLPAMQRFSEQKAQQPPLPRRKYKEVKSPERQPEAPVKNGDNKERRRLSRSQSRSRSKSPPPSDTPQSHRHSSRSPSPQRVNFQRSRGRSKSRSRSPGGSKRRSPDRRSVSPPSFMGSGPVPHEKRLDESNKGHQLLKKMGWSGAGGLGTNEQGIQDPVDAGDVRDRQDMYKGIGVNLNDPYENFRKSKGQAFINRMKARAEELGKN